MFPSESSATCVGDAVPVYGDPSRDEYGAHLSGPVPLSEYPAMYVCTRRMPRRLHCCACPCCPAHCCRLSCCRWCSIRAVHGKIQSPTRCHSLAQPIPHYRSSVGSSYDVSAVFLVFVYGGVYYLRLTSADDPTQVHNAAAMVKVDMVRGISSLRRLLRRKEYIIQHLQSLNAQFGNETPAEEVP